MGAARTGGAAAWPGSTLAVGVVDCNGCRSARVSDLTAGVTATIVLLETTRNCSAGAPKKSTEVVPARSSPVRVTVVPPPSGPLEGETDVTSGLSGGAAGIAEGTLLVVTDATGGPAGLAEGTVPEVVGTDAEGMVLEVLTLGVEPDSDPALGPLGATGAGLAVRPRAVLWWPE
jgi:hypothetical protein